MIQEESRALGWIVVAFLVFVVAAGTADLILDRPTGLTPHVAVELAIVVLAGSMAVWLALGWARAGTSLARARIDLARRQAERDEWRARAESALAGLGRAMEQQMQAWGLTPAEREVAFHLVRGHSHKLIARLTDRSERTVRQHAIAVYQKAGLAGRAELAAFFLRDIPTGLESRPE